MVFDIHSHIIPKVDDGSDNVRESVGMLNLLHKQGVDKVVATPHFYADKYGLEEYLTNVAQEYGRLQLSTQGQELPEMLLGYEVYYFRGISSFDGLERLCINGSNYILIELPYAKLSQRVVIELTDIAINRGLIPIIAHVDRYFKYSSLNELIGIFKDGLFKGQVNADSFASGLNRRKALALLESGCCQYIGSDAHNLTSRPPHIDKALEYIEKKIGWRYINQIDRESTLLYGALTAGK